LQAIRDVARMEPNLRTEEQVNDILEFVKDVKFFTKLSPLQQKTLCRMMKIETFAAKEYVFQYGEYGSKFYIILTGMVGVLAPNQNKPCPVGLHGAEKCDCAGRPFETVTFLDKGSGFGEIALQKDQPRSATIQANEATELLVTTKEDYDQYAGELHKQFIQHRVSFLRQCPYVEEALQQELFTMQDLIQMANCLNEQDLSGQSLACRQGTEVDRVIFVRSGSLAALRLVEVDANGRPQVTPKNSRPGTKGGGTQSEEEKEKAAAEGLDPLAFAGAMAQKLVEMKGSSITDMKRRERRRQMSEIEKKQREAEEDMVAELGGVKGFESPARQGDGAENKVSFGAADEVSSPPQGGGSSASTSLAPPQNPKPASGQQRRSGVKISDTEASVTSGASETENERGSSHSRGPGSTSPRRRAKQVWKKVRTAVKKAGHVEMFCKSVRKEDVGLEVEDFDSVTAAEKNVEHFKDVQIARQKYVDFSKHQLADKLSETRSKKGGVAAKAKVRPSYAVRNPPPHGTMTSRPSSSGHPTSQLFSRSFTARGSHAGTLPGGFRAETGVPAQKFVGRQKRLLRIGTIGPYQYFGDQQVTTNEKYPVSLLSDPVADTYVLNKIDIIRKLSKRLQNFFGMTEKRFPNDMQLIDMQRQTERWDAFRASIHRDAVGSRKSKFTICGIPRTMRNDGDSFGFLSTEDASKNLEFLGMDPTSPLAAAAMKPPTARRCAALTPRDEELFSQASARFLRRVDVCERDRGLRKALAQLGCSTPRRHGGLVGEEQDPQAFKLEQYWSKLRKDPIGLDLTDIGVMNWPDETTTSAGSKGRESISMKSGGPLTERPLSERAGRHNRRGSVTASDTKRPSALHLSSSDFNNTGAGEENGERTHESDQPEPSPRGRLSSVNVDMARRDMARRRSMLQAQGGAGFSPGRASGAGASVELPPIKKDEERRTVVFAGPE